MISSVILFLFYHLPAALDPQGGSNDSCISEPLVSVPGSQGMLVTGHHTFCDNFIHDPAVYHYLNKNNRGDSPASLFFRYADKPLLDPPKVHWLSDSEIEVSVGDVVQITKIWPSIDGICIEYSIGREEFSR